MCRTNCVSTPSFYTPSSLSRCYPLPFFIYPSLFPCVRLLLLLPFSTISAPLPLPYLVRTNRSCLKITNPVQTSGTQVIRHRTEPVTSSIPIVTNRDALNHGNIILAISKRSTWPSTPNEGHNKSTPTSRPAPDLPSPTLLPPYNGPLLAPIYRNTETGFFSRVLRSQLWGYPQTFPPDGHHPH